jgi:23S rRNA (uracil1939-C5)-methyltransferase
MELTIEKMVYGGEGLARYVKPGEVRGKTVFVPFVLPEERVTAQSVEEKSGFARAQLQSVLTPSKHRIEPRCPYFQRCGGCHYQHSSYEYQLQMKSVILRETLLRTAKIDWPGEIHAHASPLWNYRNRTRMKLQSQPFALGYHQWNSHTLLPVEECPISSPLINRAIAHVWRLGREEKFPECISEIEFFADADDERMLLEFVVTEHSSASHAQLAALAEELRAQIPQAAGIAFFQAQRHGLPLPYGLPSALSGALGSPALQYRVGTNHYQVSAGSFFQTNRFLIEKLLDLATAERSGDSALDLYAGAGLFTVSLSQRFKKVNAVESAPASCGDLRKNCAANVAVCESSAEEFLCKTNKAVGFDFAVADPPRAGLQAKVARRLGALDIRRLLYVSCDPATLARDLKILLESGYRIEQIHLVDLFPQTYHLESVISLVR